jgi:hypothetical protein
MNMAGQSKSAPDCGKELKGFINDSQEYLIDFKEISTFDIIFYSGFIYRLEFCSEGTNTSFNLSLVDEKGNVQFNELIKPGFFRDFKFDTVFHGKILVKPVNHGTQPCQMLIGYKKIKTNN